MKIKKFAALMSIYFIFFSMASSAADSTITMTATVVASPCTVSSDSISQTIALDGGKGFQSKDLQTAGAKTAWVDFDVKLIDCPTGTSNATMTFSGTEDADDSKNYANSGTAKNIAVELFKKDALTTDYPLSNGTSLTTPIENGTATFAFSVRAATTKGSVTPGTVQSVVTATMTYQ